MSNIFTRLFSTPVDPEVLMALRYKLPNGLTVTIHADPSGKYVARITDDKHFARPIVTEGSTGQELFEMVNDAVYTTLDIPEAYRPYMTAFFPPEDIREALAIKIPSEYLDKTMGFVKV
jgi:hypothetical protein